MSGQPVFSSLTPEEYKADPCKVLSLPYWKAKSMSTPCGMRIVHDSEFDSGLLEDFSDRMFFRLRHSLENIPEFDIPEVNFEVVTDKHFNDLADMINLSYTHLGIGVSENDVAALTKTEAYCPELWIGAFFSGCPVGSVICDFDSVIGEGVIEWLQVIPGYRGRGIASALVCRALKTMRNFADFATVSGECDNITRPERIYRKCGFEGNDIWHVLSPFI